MASRNNTTGRAATSSSAIDWDSYTGNAAVPTGAPAASGPTDPAAATTTGSDSPSDSYGSDSIDPSGTGYGNSTDFDDGSNPPTSSSDSAGNTVFFLAIVAFIAVALGLGIFLWRKHNQGKTIGGKVDDMMNNGKTSFFSKKGRPSPLPLNRIRTAEENGLPAYSPHTAGMQAPWATGENPHAGAQLANTAAGDATEQARAASIAQMSLKARRDAAEKNGNLFSPFAPFSPVTSTAQAANSAANPGTPATSSFNFTGNARSLYQNNMPAPSRFMDPEAAQAMGIHPSVVQEADSGVSDDEIERRRARAQRRLEERQRAEEGSVVEDTMSEAPSFRKVARERMV